jgi:hypothetical protein
VARRQEAGGRGYERSIRKAGDHCLLDRGRIRGRARFWANAPNSVAAYRLSDGGQRWRVKTNGPVVASPDGRLLAMSLPGPVLAIFSMPEGKRVGTVPIPGSPIGFSGDGSMIAVTLPTTPRFQSYLVEWPTGITVWTHNDGVAVLASEPKGPAMIVMTSSVGVGAS